MSTHNICFCTEIRKMPIFLLARLFSKKTTRYCHRSGVVCVVIVVQKLGTFCNISVITEDIYLKLGLVVHYEKGNSYQ